MAAFALFLSLLVGTTLSLPTTNHEQEVSSYIPGTTLIVGGDPAILREFLHIVSIRLSDSHWCGGSIINSQYILTAAHCVSYSATFYTVSAGDHNLTTNEGTEQVRSVSVTIVHESYGSPTRYSNDIAILRLSSPLTLNAYVRAATLPSANFNLTSNATVAGWGNLWEGSVAGSDILMKVTVPYVSASSCNSSYPSTYMDQLMVCYGQSGWDSCQGDSGGPLMCGTCNTLCGIVSYGGGCARPEYPGVYTRVSHYISWIHSQINA